MNRRRGLSLGALLVAILLPLHAGCGSDPPRDFISLSPEVRVEIWEEGSVQFVRFAAIGAISDEGTVERSLMNFGGIEVHGYRILKGSRGDILVEVHAMRSSVAGLVADGTFTFRRGTGAYAEIQGSGDFLVERDGNGSFKEVLDGCCYGLQAAGIETPL